MSVGGRTVMGAMGWVALISYSNRLVGFLTTLLLARMLAPEHFGLVALASILIEILTLLKDMGLSEAVIYQKRDDQAAIDTANTILVSFNVVMFVLAALLSPLVARYYETPAVMPVIIIMASNMVWDSMRAVPRALLRKQLEFRRLLIPELVPVIVSCVVSIAMALTGWGVWSLVAKTVIHSVLAMLLLRPLTAHKPRLFRFDRTAARELLQYGRFIMSTTILLVILYNIDRFYVSRVNGLVALGFFELAMRIADMPVKQFSFIVGSVMFPVFSKLDAAGGALGAVSLKTLRYTAIVSVPMALGLAVYGPPLLRTFYGPRWEGMLLPLQVLAFYALFRSLSSIMYDAFKATGQPKLMQRFVVAKLAAIGILGVPALTYGLVGICVLILVAYAASFVVEVVVFGRLVGIRAADGYRVLVTPSALSAATIPTTYVLLLRAAHDPPVVLLLAGVCLSIAGYIGILTLVDRTLISDLRRLRRPSPAPASASI